MGKPMERPDPAESGKINRRTLLKGGLAAGGLIGAGVAIDRLAAGSGRSPSPKAATTGRAARVPPTGKQPNILVILVDQLRFPQWFSTSPGSLDLPPNLQSLSRDGVSFARHYTASNDCSPSRAALLTGLYTHQTGCLITGGSTLDPAFPTWGTMLREHGYSTRWYGKWHLTRGDYRWTRAKGAPALEHYGFAGGTFPSPDGDPGQGWRVDPRIAAEFAAWFAQEGRREPWCTTVSFVNPHDIAWWYAWTQRVPAETAFARLIRQLPPNFETPQQLITRRKPLLQRSLQDTAASSFGKVPFSGPQLEHKWLAFLDLYVKLQREVDRHVGSVLRTLAGSPQVAANTVVVFTSDHGEYGASHGLRGKGAGVYEEAIRVPLIVKDPRGVLTSAPEQVRTQLTCSVDVAPLLLTVATGSDAWRGDPHYSHIAGRLDLAGVLADPSAPGRPYVLHATDEIVTEFAVEPYAADAPLHVVAMRTAGAKYATYSDWARESTDALPIGQESELYDYRSQDGRLELNNGAGQSALEASMHANLEQAVATELHAPLPPGLDAAQRRGFADYFSVARQDAKLATSHRKVRTERDIGPVDRLEGPEA
jgi:arylsulfatase A-like enzyme